MIGNVDLTANPEAINRLLAVVRLMSQSFFRFCQDARNRALFTARNVILACTLEYELWLSSSEPRFFSGPHVPTPNTSNVQRHVLEKELFSVRTATRLNSVEENAVA